MVAMTDDFLHFYNDELAHLRQAGRRFAAAHPEVAGRLRFSAEGVDDPLVARLTEAFAFLTAGLRQKLDDDLPELTDAMLDMLYPHLMAPVPATAIVRFTPRPDLVAPYHLPAGTAIDSEPVEGQRCRFHTVYPVALWPQALVAAELGCRPTAAARLPEVPGARGLLRLSLARPAGQVAPLRWPGRLRLYLRGAAQDQRRLYALLNNEVCAVAFCPRVTGGDAADVVPAPPWPMGDAGSVTPGGLDAAEGLLPYGRQSLMGYRLLSEYFACPEKFMFVDIAFPRALADALAVPQTTGIDLYVYLRQWPADLERQVSANSFALGCTPVINFFPHASEPLHIAHAMGEYRVQPDARRPDAYEVHRIEAVRAMRRDGSVQPFAPFFSGAARSGAEGVDGAASRASDALSAGDPDGAAYWHAARRRAYAGEASDVHLTLVDGRRRPLDLVGATLAIDCLCCNGDLPARLPFGGAHPAFSLAGGAPVAAIACLTPPTPVLRRRDEAGTQRRLISHLVLNHLSLAGGEAGLATLKEILALHDISGTAESRAAIDSLRGLAGKPGIARLPGCYGALCRGVDLIVSVDAARLQGGEAFLLATVLERFLGLTCGVNAFTRLALAVHGGEVVKRWPARAGERILL